MCYSKMTIGKPKNDLLIVYNMSTGEEETITVEEFLKKYGV